VGDKEILETYVNSASKNTSETDTFPHGTKSLLTIVISPIYFAVGAWNHVYLRMFVIWLYMTLLVAN